MEALNLHCHPIGLRASVCFAVVSTSRLVQSTMDTDSRQRYHRVSDMYGIIAYILAVSTYTKYHRVEISLKT